jgi:hypothetical protein
MAGNKYLKNNAGTITEEAALQASTGASDAGAIPALDVTGRLDVTMMPVGIAADVAVVAASENLAAGDLVNIFNDTGTPKVRKADATTVGKEAHGFVQAGVTSGANATIYFEGTNANVTGQTAGPVFLSTTAGLSTSTAPSAAGNVVQRVGFATSSTTMNFQSNDPIVLA